MHTSVALVPGEAAEGASHVADVGEVHVAVDHERDVVATVLAARDIGSLHQGVEIAPLGAQQRRGLLGRHLAPFQRCIENPDHLGAGVGEQAFEHHAASTFAPSARGRT
jgi:hypothetical protein